MPLIISIALLAASVLTAAMKIRPVSSISILAPDSSTIFLIILPPGPITLLIFSGSTLMVVIFGAYGESSARGAEMHSIILLMMNSRPRLACANAWVKISLLIPSILISIWIAVIPLSVPATLKSISPRASSKPWMSVKMVKYSPSFTRPIATPATGALMGTPASIKDKVEPQTEPMEEEPLDSKTSETRRIAYGNSSSEGITGSNARSAKAP